MSATTRAPAAANRRASPRRHAPARRRRRALVALCVVVACVAGALAAAPLFRRAIDEFMLPLHYASIIRTQAREKHLQPALIAAVIYAETKFDGGTSSAGAEGLMQIEPQTAEFLARRSGATDFQLSDLGTPAVNIAYGSYYLRYLLNEYHGSMVAALAAYNGGETNVDRWMARAGVRARAFTTSEITFPQTRAYVEKVLQAERKYRRTYAKQLGYG